MKVKGSRSRSQQSKRPKQAAVGLRLKGILVQIVYWFHSFLLGILLSHPGFFSLILLERVESKVICLTGHPSLTSNFDPLSLRCKMASLSLFYRCYFGHCPDELAACIPPPMAQAHSTWQASFANNYCVEFSNARINRFSDGFFPFYFPPLEHSTFLLYFRLPSAFLPSKGRFITT